MPRGNKRPEPGLEGTAPISSANFLTNPPLPEMLDLVEQLRFSPQEGRIWLSDQRMILVHNEVFGALRHELIETIGIEAARGLITRMGYLAGARDAALARTMRPTHSPFDTFMVGPQLHALEGFVVADILEFAMDSETGLHYSEFVWKDSAEADAHIAIHGIGSVPACWREVGYASGYASSFMGKRILVREVECRAMGHTHCRGFAKSAEDWDNPELDLKYLTAQPVERRLSSFAASIPRVRPTGQQTKIDRNIGQVDADKPVGASVAFNTTLHKINRVASTRASVLLLGESGVGKSLLAQEVHKRSPRSQKPFIQINCAAIPEQLIEAELFGVERGAYTGASETRFGRFEVADGGTLFLDEVAALTPIAQGKLLRVLQTGEMEHLGSNKTRTVDVRILAATNENLSDAIRQGRFREDLFYRLNVFPIVIPPLRERQDDIPVLLEYSLHKFSKRHGRAVVGVTDRALQAILNHPWPGNIRELENVIERGLILAEEGQPLDIFHLFTIHDDFKTENAITSNAQGLAMLKSEPLDASETFADDVDVNIDGWAARMLRDGVALFDVENALVRAAVEKTGGNVSRAASLLGITRSQLDYRIKKLND